MKKICGVLVALSLVLGTAAFAADKTAEKPKTEQSKTSEKVKTKSEATTKIPQTKGQNNQKDTKGKAGEPKAQ